LGTLREEQPMAKTKTKPGWTKARITIELETEAHKMKYKDALVALSVRLMELAENFTARLSWEPERAKYEILVEAQTENVDKLENHLRQLGIPVKVT
jgi:hypothetical protein